MENNIQSSFIPQDAGEVKLTAPKIGGGAGFSELLLFLCIILVVASGALAGSVFVYKQYMQTSVNFKKDQLQKAKEAFDPSLIQEFTRLDDRMHAGSAIMAQHLAPSIFLDILGQATLTTIYYSTMTLDTADPQQVKVSLSGVAQSLNSIALQAQLFGKHGVIAKPVFTGIARSADGVHFNLSLVVNPKALSYEQTFTSSNSQNTQQSQQTTQKPTSPFGGTGGQVQESSQTQQTGAQQ